MNDLSVIEHKQQRVLTTSQLAEVYETDEKNIQMNFSNNKERFQEGRDYYILEGEELKQFKNYTNDIGLVKKHTPQIYVWTERGANRHCKILDTNRAWEQFDVLEETYFKSKQSTQKNIDFSLLPPELQIANNLLIAVAEQQLKLHNIENTIATIKETVITHIDNWREDINKMCNKIASMLGINEYKNFKSESYKLLEQRAGVNLESRLKNYKGRLLEAGVRKTDINKANKLDCIEQDRKLKEIYAGIVKEYTIKYCA
jgi:hypothetical protein